MPSFTATDFQTITLVLQKINVLSGCAVQSTALNIPGTGRRERQPRSSFSPLKGEFYGDNSPAELKLDSVVP